jgi:NhaP-type Na+/H+ or K+/H+ antiporter
VGKSRRCKTGSNGDGTRSDLSAGRADERRQSSLETYSGTLRYCFPSLIHHRLTSPADHELSLSIGRLISIAVLVPLLRRLPIIIGLYKWIPDIKSLREALFSGHFGPIGIGTSSPPSPHRVSRKPIGAIFMSTLAAETLPRPQSPLANQAELLAAPIQPVITFMVLCSILIHGLSITFFSLGRC